jgi:hypothetical protein
MAQDRQALAMQYLQLLQSGVPASEAFKQVYPNGVPTQQQQAAAESKKKQGSALAATGGTISGLLAIKYGDKYLDSLGKVKTVTDAQSAAEAAQASQAANGTTAGVSGTETAGAGAAGVAAGSSLGGAAGAGTVGISNMALANAGAQGSGIAGGTTASTGATASGSGGLAAGAGAGLVGLGTLLAAKSAYNQYQGKEDNSTSGKAGRAQLAWSTGGISEIARALGIGGNLSTRDQARKNTQGLFNQAKDDDTAKNYIAGMREQYLSGPTDPSKPFAGKYQNFEEYKNAGLDPKDLTGVYGNIKTFGPEWAHLTQDQRESVTQGLIGANLYDSKKGEVVITDPEKAKQIYATIIKPVPVQQQAAGSPVAQTMTPAQSEAFKKKQLAQTGQFGNQLFQALNNQNQQRQAK